MEDLSICCIQFWCHLIDKMKISVRLLSIATICVIIVSEITTAVLGKYNLPDGKWPRGRQLGGGEALARERLPSMKVVYNHPKKLEPFHKSEALDQNTSSCLRTF